jgi:hypothetical protein
VPTEVLAFPIVVKGEVEVLFIYAEPLSLITGCLEGFKTFDQVASGLPDLDVDSFPKSDFYVQHFH